jgi:hypothetical protein
MYATVFGEYDRETSDRMLPTARSRSLARLIERSVGRLSQLSYHTPAPMEHIKVKGLRDG